MLHFGDALTELPRQCSVCVVDKKRHPIRAYIESRWVRVELCVSQHFARFGQRKLAHACLELFHREEIGAAQERLQTIKKRLDEQARICVATKINRVPRIATAVLRAFERAGLLGRNMAVVGTVALYAYEAAAGCQLDAGLMATADIDVLWDARSRLSPVVTRVEIPVPVSCLPALPQRPRITPAGELRAMSSGQYILTVSAERLELIAYADELDAALAACRQ